MFASKEEVRQKQYELNLQWWAAYSKDPKSEETKTLRAELDRVTEEGVQQFAKPQVPGCRECEVYSVFGGPSHHASSFCRSGKRPHCTCDTCF